MSIDTKNLTINAPRLVASIFGVLAGIGGVTHGIGEVLQGNHPPSAMMFDSWTVGPIATAMDGDPALSLIPNLLISGLLTLVVSTVTIVWAAAFVQRRNGGHVLLALSVVMLLVGGGVGSPVVGILAGVAGILIHAPLRWWRRHLPDGAVHALAVLWPWTFAIALLSGLFLFVGAQILICFVEITNSDLFFYNFLFTAGSLAVVLLTTIGYIIEHGGQEEYTPPPNARTMSANRTA